MIAGKRRFFTGATAAIAREKLRSWLRSPESRRPRNAIEHRTVSELLDAFLWNVKVARADKTFRSYESIIRLHIKPRIGSLDPKRVTSGVISDMLEDMRTSPIAIVGKPRNGKAKRTIGSRTRELTFIILGAALKKVAPDALSNVERPRTRAREIHPWTSAEASKFLKSIEENLDVYRLLYRIALRTGARKGELLALRVRDLDNGAIRITKSYNDKLRDDGPTKTPSSRRTVAMSSETVAAVKAHIRATGIRDDDRLFVVQDIRKLTKQMQRAMRQAGVPVIRFHDLRHTFATLALKANVPVKVVSEMLGHASVKMTLDVYAHTLPGMHESAVQALENAF